MASPSRPSGRDLLEVQDRGGNQHAQELMGLRDAYGGRFGPAIAQLNNLLVSTAGICSRKKSAVIDFCRDLDAEYVPDWREAIVLAVLDLAISEGLSRLGAALVARGKRVAGALGAAAMDGAQRVGVGDEHALDAGIGVESAVEGVLAAAVDRASEAVGGSVRSSLRMAGSRATAEEFQTAQIEALDATWLEAAGAMNQALGQLQAEPRLCWAVIGALSETLQAELQTAYDTQFAGLTDVWFANQAQTVAPGHWPGVLQIQLERAFPDSDRVRIERANLTGAGAASERIREHLGQRPLHDIGVPMVIMMNGKMGFADCRWILEVHGAAKQQPTVVREPGAADPLAERYLAEPPRIQGVSGGPLGMRWLAARGGGARELDADDPRSSEANTGRGAYMMWRAVRDLKPGPITNSML